MVEPFPTFLLLLVAVTLLSVVGRWFPFPPPVTLTLGGLGLSFLPGFYGIALDPDLFFILFLPPLLFADGWLMPLRELVRVKRPVFLLVVGLVLVTIFTVGATAVALVPGLPWAMAFALGAVVSPTDAVAVSAITSRLRVPERITAILNGESLLNDATGLVAFRFALLAAAAGSISLVEVTGSFLLLASGGLILGLVIGYAVGKLRDLMRHVGAADPLSETTLSLMTPFACYLAATAIDVSPILAVVAAGLYSGWRDPIRMDVETRQTAWNVWEIFLYWLNGFAFLLLGLSARPVIAAVAHQFSTFELVLYPLIVSAVAIVGRILWVYGGAWLPRLLSRKIRQTEPAPDPAGTFIVGWAGMRGAVTLAAALSIPLAMPSGDPMPGREVVIFLALGVVAVTLLIQGTTLEPLIRLLKVTADSSLEEEERQARIAAVRAGLAALEREKPAITNPHARQSLDDLLTEYQNRLHLLTAEGDTREQARTRVEANRKFHLLALQAERNTLDQLWRDGAINDTVHRPLQIVLDHEEAMIRQESSEPQGTTGSS